MSQLVKVVSFTLVLRSAETKKKRTRGLRRKVSGSLNNCREIALGWGVSGRYLCRPDQIGVVSCLSIPHFRHSQSLQFSGAAVGGGAAGPDEISLQTDKVSVADKV